MSHHVMFWVPFAALIAIGWVIVKGTGRYNPRGGKRMKAETRKEEAARMWRQEHPAFLGKLACGHAWPFVKKPIMGWEEWCDTCQDYCTTIDGV